MVRLATRGDFTNKLTGQRRHMNVQFSLRAKNIEELFATAGSSDNPGIATPDFIARVASPNYAAAVARHYGPSVGQIDAPAPFRHFGLCVAYRKPTRVQLYDESRRLLDGVRDAIATFGPLLFRNAVSALPDQEPQRNIFPSLRFHVDRAPPQEELYSMFYRDPLDPVQRNPRGSTTLFIANAVGLLQARKEGLPVDRVPSSCDLFQKENIDALVGQILLEQRWDAPVGIGEIAVLDNRTLLHASYYKHQGGYPISVRYIR